MSDCVALEKYVELIDDIDRRVAEVAEHFNHGMLSQSPDIPKHYLESKIDIHVHVRVRQGKEICAVFRVKDAELYDGAKFRRVGWVGTHGSSWWVQSHAPFEARGHLHLGHSDNNRQKPVLVHNVKVMDDPEGVHFSLVPSMVRLQPLDHCGGRFAGSLYLSKAVGSKFLPVREDRKLDFGLDPSGVGVSVRLDQLPREMVKAGAEMVDGLASDNCEPSNGFRVSRIPDLIFDPSGIRVVIFRHFIEVSEERPDHRVKALDVLVGPVNLDLATFEWMRHRQFCDLKHGQS